MKKICNKDCFNCPYEDCINDEMDHEDYREAADRDRELFMTPAKRKNAAKNKACYEANREKIAAKNKAYYEANREKIAAKQKAYREANREKSAAGKKAYREANRETYNRYQREYMRRKRNGSCDSVRSMREDH